MNKIKYFRLKQGLRLKNLVAATGLSMGHLSNLENGNKEPSKATMEVIARAFGRTVPDVFYAEFTAEEAAYLAVKEGGTNERQCSTSERNSAEATHTQTV